MVQLSLVPLRIVDDYGAVGRGASAAHYVLAENGSEYLVKGPSLTPDHPYVAANELIAAGLATQLGLPVLDYRVLEMGGHLFFGSSWMASSSFDPAITEVSLSRCENIERVYDVVVFDIWICNQDRHHENLVVRRIKHRSSPGERLLLLLNDHSHSLIQPGQAISSLSAVVNSLPDGYRRLDFLWDEITDTGRLSEALRRVEVLTDTNIGALVNSIPTELLSPTDRAPMRQFLVERRLLLRGIVLAGRASFRRLAGGTM